MTRGGIHVANIFTFVRARDSSCERDEDEDDDAERESQRKNQSTQRDARHCGGESSSDLHVRPEIDRFAARARHVPVTRACQALIRSTPCTLLRKLFIIIYFTAHAICYCSRENVQE